MARYVTAIYDVWTAVADLLQATPMSTHPNTGHAPTVWFGGVDSQGTPAADLGVEYVVVSCGDTEDAQEWATNGRPGKDEAIAIRIVIGTHVPGCTGRQVVERLAELTTVVGQALRDSTTGMPVDLDVPSSNAAVGVGISRVEPVAWPAAEGWEGQATIVVGGSWRI